MPFRLGTVLLALALIATSCGDGETKSPPEAAEETPSFGEVSPGAVQPATPFEVAEVTLSGDGGEVTIDVQVAGTDQQRQIGLMWRTDLPDDAGMWFEFEERIQSGFWMKDTLVPLSIAFIDEGTVVDILDMEPCEADPCDIYTPSEPYTDALEVNQGMFAEWGISEGDAATLAE
jgi:uncharacterized membrane protein (UPF0127 family)